MVIKEVHGYVGWRVGITGRLVRGVRIFSGIISNSGIIIIRISFITIRDGSFLSTILTNSVIVDA